MQILKNIRILNNHYNWDLKNPTAFWPKEKIFNRVEMFNLDILPKSYNIKIPENNDVTLIVGPNAVGKSVFLKSISRSLENAKFYDEHGYTSIFGSTIGVDSIFEGKYDTSKSKKIFGSESDKKTHIGDSHFYMHPIGIPSFYKPDHIGGPYRPASSINTYLFFNFSTQPVRYFRSAMNFYVRQDSIFDNDFFRSTTALKTDEECYNIARLLTYDTNGTDIIVDGRSLEDDHNVYLNELSRKTGIKRLDLVQRIAFILGAQNLVVTMNVPENRFGQYELETSKKPSQIELYYVDQELQLNGSQELSKGQYVIRELEKIVSKNPKSSLILLDEPTANLDRNSRKLFTDYVANLQKQNHILIASHDESLDKTFNNSNVLSFYNNKVQFE